LSRQQQRASSCLHGCEHLSLTRQLSVQLGRLQPPTPLSDLLPQFVSEHSASKRLSAASLGLHT
jgi:hypothetical protein